MATRLEGISLVMGGWRDRHHAEQLAVAAGRDALHKVGRQPAEVELLINAGLYRDRNLGEPALAPLIQEDIEANPADPHGEGHGTFSFDVANGGCGVLTALQITDGFLRSGAAGVGLVVTSDANPGHGLAPSFPFSPAGAAMLCNWTEGELGLGSFGWETFPDEGEALRSTVAMAKGRNVLDVREGPDFGRRAGAAAVVAAGKALANDGLDVGAVDLVVASPCRPPFTKALCEGLGIASERVVTAGPDLHTAAFVAAWALAERTGRLVPGGTVLLVCGAAGITAGAAIYRS
jgi:3-oxoacyl-[acyl-carrier-protein] synthase-3